MSGTSSMSGSGNADVSSRITEWRLSGSDIQSDLDRSAPIVRTKGSVGAPTGSMDDSVLTTMVKGKLQADSQLSTAASRINVEAHNGEVTLKGDASSADEVGRAIALALNTDGVSKVTADMKVQGSNTSNTSGVK